MRAFACHLQFEFFTGLRNKSLLMMYYLMPLGFFAVVGSVMSELNPFFREMAIPSMVTFAILTGTIMGLPSPLLEAREKGIFRNFRVHGVPAANILLIPALTAGIHLGVVTLIITFTAPLLFSAPLPSNWLLFFLGALTFLITGAGLGVLIGIVAGNNRICFLLAQMIYLPGMLLGGLMIPTDQLPQFIGWFSRILPTTYAMDAMLSLGWGEPVLNIWPLGGILVLLAGGILSFVLAGYLFSWDQNNYTRRGPSFLAALVLIPFILGAIFL